MRIFLENAEKGIDFMKQSRYNVFLHGTKCSFRVTLLEEV